VTRSHHLVVQLGEERYALRVEDVLEVGAVHDPAPMPGAPSGVLGLQNRRGEILPLLDLASMVGIGTPSSGRAMVVVEHGGRRAAVSVDGLLDVVLLADEASREHRPPVRSSALVDGALVGVLDVRALLDAVQEAVAA
jgi:chemotaxis signal transduction protein